MLRLGKHKTKSGNRISLLKVLFWLYFLLLIFEGALRKWVLPQFSGPLLLVRDPIALLIIWEAYRTHKWPKRWALAIALLTLGTLALTITQMIVGQSLWFIEAYGLRSYLLPFPVAFIMGENLDGEDLRRFGACTLWLLFPIVGLEVAQYLAPVDSILNTGAYKGLTQIGYVSGHVRASSTFSFVTGPAMFMPMAAAFALNGFARANFAKKGLLWAASALIVLSIPVTGSRSMVTLLAGVLGCVAIAAFCGISHFAGTIKLITALAFIGLLVSQLPIFSESMGSLTERITEAGEAEGGVQGTLANRVTDPIVDAFESGVSSDNWYGKGLGFGSNMAATLLTGTQTFLAGEGEFARVIFEFGGPCGLAFMLFRIGLAMMIAVKALFAARQGEPLAWLLVPLVLMGLMDPLEQPTSQGFTVMSLSFALAALRRFTNPALSGEYVRHVPAISAPVLRAMSRTAMIHGSGRPGK